MKRDLARQWKNEMIEKKKATLTAGQSAWLLLID
jgi:hypothetical protein